MKKMSRMKKGIITSVSGVLALVCVITMITGVFGAGSETLNYINSIKKDFSDGSFKILEIAPTTSSGTIGYYIAGQEPIQGWAEKASTFQTAAQRRQYYESLKANLIAKGILSGGDTTPMQYGDEYEEFYPWDTTADLPDQTITSARRENVDLEDKYVELDLDESELVENVSGNMLSSDDDLQAGTEVDAAEYEYNAETGFRFAESSDENLFAPAKFADSLGSSRSFGFYDTTRAIAYNSQNQVVTVFGTTVKNWAKFDDYKNSSLMKFYDMNKAYGNGTGFYCINVDPGSSYEFSCSHKITNDSAQDDSAQDGSAQDGSAQDGSDQDDSASAQIVIIPYTADGNPVFNTPNYSKQYWYANDVVRGTSTYNCSFSTGANTNVKYIQIRFDVNDIETVAEFSNIQLKEYKENLFSFSDWQSSLTADDKKTVSGDSDNETVTVDMKAGLIEGSSWQPESSYYSLECESNTKYTLIYHLENTMDDGAISFVKVYGAGETFDEQVSYSDTKDNPLADKYKVLAEDYKTASGTYRCDIETTSDTGAEIKNLGIVFGVASKDLNRGKYASHKSVFSNISICKKNEFIKGEEPTHVQVIDHFVYSDGESTTQSSDTGSELGNNIFVLDKFIDSYCFDTNKSDDIDASVYYDTTTRSLNVKAGVGVSSVTSAYPGSGDDFSAYYSMKVTGGLKYNLSADYQTEGGIGASVTVNQYNSDNVLVNSSHYDCSGESGSLYQPFYANQDANKIIIYFGGRDGTNVDKEQIAKFSNIKIRPYDQSKYYYSVKFTQLDSQYIPVGSVVSNGFSWTEGTYYAGDSKTPITITKTDTSESKKAHYGDLIYVLVKDTYKVVGSIGVKGFTISSDELYYIKGDDDKFSVVQDFNTVPCGSTVYTKYFGQALYRQKKGDDGNYLTDKQNNMPIMEYIGYIEKVYSKSGIQGESFSAKESEIYFTLNENDGTYTYIPFAKIKKGMTLYTERARFESAIEGYVLVTSEKYYTAQVDKTVVDNNNDPICPVSVIRDINHIYYASSNEFRLAEDGEDAYFVADGIKNYVYVGSGCGEYRYVLPKSGEINKIKIKTDVIFYVGSFKNNNWFLKNVFNYTQEELDAGVANIDSVDYNIMGVSVSTVTPKELNNKLRNSTYLDNIESYVAGFDLIVITAGLSTDSGEVKYINDLNQTSYETLLERLTSSIDPTPCILDMSLAGTGKYTNVGNITGVERDGSGSITQPTGIAWSSTKSYYYLDGDGVYQKITDWGAIPTTIDIYRYDVDDSGSLSYLTSDGKKFSRLPNLIKEVTSYNTYGGVTDNVYRFDIADLHLSSSDVSKNATLANKNFNTEIETYSADSTGSEPYYEVYDEIVSENNANGTSISTAVTEATAIRCILNYRGRLVESTKEKIRVLDLEPYTNSPATETAQLTTSYVSSSDSKVVLKTTPGLTKNEVINWFRKNVNGTDTFLFNADDIEITTMAIAEFNGKNDKLSETYDLIYFGSSLTNMNFRRLGDDSDTDEPYHYEKDAQGNLVYKDDGTKKVSSEWKNVLIPDYNDSKNMDGLYYTNIGDVFYGKNADYNALHSNDGLLGGLYANDYYFADVTKGGWNLTADYELVHSNARLKLRFTGNDITANKLKELQDFAKAGYPIVMSADLTRNDWQGELKLEIQGTVEKQSNGIPYGTIVADYTGDTLPSGVQPIFTWYKGGSEVKEGSKEYKNYVYYADVDADGLDECVYSFPISVTKVDGYYTYYTCKITSFQFTAGKYESLVKFTKPTSNRITLNPNTLKYKATVNYNEISKSESQAVAVLELVDTGDILPEPDVKSQRVNSNNQSVALTDDYETVISYAFRNREAGASWRESKYVNWSEYSFENGQFTFTESLEAKRILMFYILREYVDVDISLSSKYFSNVHIFTSADDRYSSQLTIGGTTSIIRSINYPEFMDEGDSKTGQNGDGVFELREDRVDNSSNIWEAMAELTGSVKNVFSSQDFTSSTSTKTKNLISAINTSKPIIAQDETKSTWKEDEVTELNDSAIINFSFELQNPTDGKARSTRYNYNVYIDWNGDGKFTGDEKLTENYSLTGYEGMSGVVPSGNVRATYHYQNKDKSGTATESKTINYKYNLKIELSGDQTGCIPWKIELVDKLNSGVSASFVSYAYRKPSTPTELNVLQILPMDVVKYNESVISGNEYKLYPKDITATTYKADKTSVFLSDAFSDTNTNGYCKREIVKKDDGTLDYIKMKIGKYADTNPDYIIYIYVTSVFHLQKYTEGQILDENDNTVTRKDIYEKFVNEDIKRTDNQGDEKVYTGYDMLFIGYGDSYASGVSEELAQAIQDYINTGRGVLYTHDTTDFHNNYYPAVRQADGYYLNLYVRDAVGMDKFGITYSILNHSELDRSGATRRESDNPEKFGYSTSSIYDASTLFQYYSQDKKEYAYYDDSSGNYLNAKDETGKQINDTDNRKVAVLKKVQSSTAYIEVDNVKHTVYFVYDETDKFNYVSQVDYVVDNSPKTIGTHNFDIKYVSINGGEGTAFTSANTFIMNDKEWKLNERTGRVNGVTVTTYYLSNVIDRSETIALDKKSDTEYEYIVNGVTNTITISTKTVPLTLSNENGVLKYSGSFSGETQAKDYSDARNWTIAKDLDNNPIWITETVTTNDDGTETRSYKWDGKTVDSYTIGDTYTYGAVIYWSNSQWNIAHDSNRNLILYDMEPTSQGWKQGYDASNASLTSDNPYPGLLYRDVDNKWYIQYNADAITPRKLNASECTGESGNYIYGAYIYYDKEQDCWKIGYNSDGSIIVYNQTSGYDISGGLSDKTANNIATLKNAGYRIAYLPGSARAQTAPEVQGYTSYIMTRNTRLGNKVTVFGYDIYSPKDGTAFGKMVDNQFGFTTGNYASNHHNAPRRTEQATQVNRGQITMYPFDINTQGFTTSTSAKSALDIDLTHEQYYTLDLTGTLKPNGEFDNDYATVWYCFGGTTNVDSEGGDSRYPYASDIYNDCSDAYYVYRYGNVTYTGAGHGNKMTSDEAKLFINVIVASHIKSGGSSELEIKEGEIDADNIIVSYTTEEQYNDGYGDGKYIGKTIPDLTQEEMDKEFTLWLRNIQKQSVVAISYKDDDGNKCESFKDINGKAHIVTYKNEEGFNYIYKIDNVEVPNYKANGEKKVKVKTVDDKDLELTLQLDKGDSSISYKYYPYSDGQICEINGLYRITQPVTYGAKVYDKRGNTYFVYTVSSGGKNKVISFVDADGVEQIQGEYIDEKGVKHTNPDGKLVKDMADAVDYIQKTFYARVSKGELTAAQVLTGKVYDENGNDVELTLEPIITKIGSREVKMTMQEFYELYKDEYYGDTNNYHINLNTVKNYDGKDYRIYDGSGKEVIIKKSTEKYVTKIGNKDISAKTPAEFAQEYKKTYYGESETKPVVLDSLVAPMTDYSIDYQIPYEVYEALADTDRLYVTLTFELKLCNSSSLSNTVATKSIQVIKFMLHELG